MFSASNPLGALYDKTRAIVWRHTMKFATAMKAINVERRPWKTVLKQQGPPLLPAAHDALSGRLLERAAFKAYQIGGFALAGSAHAVPDVGLDGFGEKATLVRQIINASPLPVLVDADDAYADTKSVTRTVREYEAMGVSALFIEDQAAPKKCGHMEDKKVIEAKSMVHKIKATCAARENREFFILARTDAIEPHGLRDALKHGEAYLNAGADGIYFEGPTDFKQLERIGKEFGKVPLAVSVLEGGGKTPWLSPKQFFELGFSMILYPTSILFRMTKAVERAASDLKNGRQMPLADAVDMKTFEEILSLQFWAQMGAKFPV
jgi:2-methylisocitrate lyase-like PEP mutase family enzyme